MRWSGSALYSPLPLVATPRVGEGLGDRGRTICRFNRNSVKRGTCHLRGKSSVRESFYGFFMPMRRCLLQQLFGFCLILGNAPPLGIHQPKFVLGVSISLIRR